MTDSQRTETDPWSDIGVSGRPDRITLRRADPAHPLDFFRARDSAGGYIFLLQMSSDIGAPTTLPVFAGMTVELRPRVPVGTEFVLSLQARDQLDLFRVLCCDLMAVTAEYGTGEEGRILSTLLLRLTRWQELLRRLSGAALDHAAVLGLFGEVLLLRDFLVPRLSALDAVRSWRGPYSDQQDFMINGWIVELKTQLATSDSKVRITSPEQLDVREGRLLLCHQTLDTTEMSHPGSHNLNSLVNEMVEILRDEPSARDLFLAALMEAGYRERAEYAAWSWCLSARSWYQVRDGFPRLLASGVPSGVENVTYSIRLEACAPYRVQDGQVASWMCDGSSES
jgi:hypothetical protein